MSRWYWQDDACWQANSEAPQAIAQAWVKDAAHWYARLNERATEQPLCTDDPATLQQIVQHAAALRAVSQQLVVVGTGGASLGAQAFCALADAPGCVQFLENCDPHTLMRMLRLPKETTSWCIISKSGETVETLAATLALIAQYDGGLAERVRVITGPHASSLRQIAERQGWEIIDHPLTLGGRFSVFSAVGMLPASYAGLDAPGIVAHAATDLRNGLAQKDAQLLPHAAWLASHFAEKPMQLLMAYADRLRPATQWYKQLWAESLGKDGKGGTPVTAIGAIDQHSQLQLYLDGPRDKLLTVWLPSMDGQSPPLADGGLPGTEYLRGRTMGDVMQATAEATVMTLRNAAVPLRVLRGALSPTSLASWMVRQMLETLLVAELIGVDPYSQPAVEEGKKLTRTALAGNAA